MALSRVKVWTAERLYSADLNAEFQNIIDNASSLISPLSGALDLDGYALTHDAAGVTSSQSTASIGWSFIPGSKSGTPGTTGAVSNWAANTYTDNGTAVSGTAAAWVGHAYQRPTIAASNATVTTTNAATVYIINSPLAGTNETLTNAWSLWVDDGHVRLDGDLNVQQDIVGTINKYSLTASVSSSALTIALKDRDGNDASASNPITFKFRSTTGGTGTYTLGSVTGALSAVISSGSTLATVSGVANRLHVGALLTGSTVELCYWNAQNPTSIYGFSDTDLTTTTAEGGAGAADFSGTMYSTTARTSVPWVYLGFIESTQATAGTWATSPSRVESNPVFRPGTVVTRVFTATGEVATGTTGTPVDNSIPQSSEGDQYMSVAITPSSAINWLRITAQGMFSVSTTSLHVTMALHQDSAADALSASVLYHAAGAVLKTATLSHIMKAGTTSATTFKIRAGTTGGNTVTFNGAGGARIYGGVANSYIQIEEIYA